MNKNLKIGKFLSLLISVVLVVLMVTASFAVVQAPIRNNLRYHHADLLAGLCQRTAQDIIKESYSNDISYGDIAYNAGVYDEYNGELLKYKKQQLDQYVKDGVIAQEEADALLDSFESNPNFCYRYRANSNDYNNYCDQNYSAPRSSGNGCRSGSYGNGRHC